jgi:hypothetical protein
MSGFICGNILFEGLSPKRRSGIRVVNENLSFSDDDRRPPLSSLCMSTGFLFPIQDNTRGLECVRGMALRQ